MQTVISHKGEHCGPRTTQGGKPIYTNAHTLTCKPQKECCPPGISPSVNRKNFIMVKQICPQQHVASKRCLDGIKLYRNWHCCLVHQWFWMSLLMCVENPNRLSNSFCSVKLCFDGFPEKQCAARRAGLNFLRSALPCLTWSYFEWSSPVIRSFVLCKGEGIYSCHILGWR